MSSPVVEVAEMAPSEDLVRALVGVDRGACGFEDMLAVVAGWERVISWATARQAQALVDLDLGLEVHRFEWHAADAARSLADQVGLALGVSAGSAQRRISTAVTLIEKLPAVHDALEAGSVTCHHARLVASQAAPVDTEVARQVAAAAMADQGWRTPTQLHDTFARLVVELDPDGAEGRNREARRGRRVSRRAKSAGMGSLWALLPAEDCEAVYDRIDACARSSMATNLVGDDRTLDARRADALVQLVCGQLPNCYDRPVVTMHCAVHPPATGPPTTDADNAGERSSDPVGAAGTCSAGSGNSPAAAAGVAPPCEPTVQGRRARVNVTVAWSTLIGLDDAPADLTGHGPIDAATARRIAADPTSTWHRLLVDAASGRLLDYGRTTYRPPQDLRDHVIARDRTCRFPTCDRPARTCDLDHRHDWEDGGVTAEHCIDAVCRRHHRLKHQDGWAHFRDPDTGDSCWFDPRGRMHRRPATTLPTPEPVEPPTPGEENPETAAAGRAEKAAGVVAPVDDPDDPPPF